MSNDDVDEWALVLGSAGLMALVCAALDLRHFMSDPVGRFIVRRFGWKGTRLIYGIAGGAMVVVAVLFMNA